MLPERTIEDLRTRYTLEPTLRDVIVEGNFDWDVITQCFRSSGAMDRVVYPIDSIEVPKEILDKYQLTTGNKQRVIALAKELASLPDFTAFRCVVDRDLDHWFGELETVRRLLWTEYCSIELYFFSSEIVRHIVVVTAEAKIVDWDRYFNSLIEILREFYALRLTDRELGCSLDWISPINYLNWNADAISFDLNTYLKRTLEKNCKANLLADFEASYGKWMEMLLGDPRQFIRGHDLIEILAWTVRNAKGIREFRSASIIKRSLVLLAWNALEIDAFLQQ